MSYPVAARYLESLLPIPAMPERTRKALQERVNELRGQVEGIEALYYETLGDGLLASAFSRGNGDEVRRSAEMAAKFYGRARRALESTNDAERKAAIDEKAAVAAAMPKAVREGKVVVQAQTDEGNGLDTLLQAVQRLEARLNEIDRRLGGSDGWGLDRAGQERGRKSTWWKPW